MSLTENFEAALSESTSNPNKILCYGCQIFLNFYDNSNNKFLAFSNGFNKNKIRFRLFENVCQNGDYIKGIFKIYPSFSNKEHLDMKNKYFKDSKQIDSLSSFEKRSIFLFF